MTLTLLEEYFQGLLSDPADPLFNWRKRAWDAFLALGLPHSKQEAFQYVPLQKGLSFPTLATPEEHEEKKENTLLFSNGFFLEKSSSVPAPLICLPLDKAMHAYAVFLHSRAARFLKEETDPFAVLNTAFHGKGAFLYIPPKTRLAKPLEIHHLFSQGLASPRLILYVGREVSAQIIQRSKGEAFCNGVVDVTLDEGAELFFCDMKTPSDTPSFQAFRAMLKKRSRLHGFFSSRGASPARTSVKVQLAEEESEALLQGLSRLTGERQNHIHALVEHLAPNTTSRQHFKSVLEEKSRFSFEGKIAVRPVAQKTQAYQLNNNLLLSDEAKANSKPNLEIFADDVKASHGSTTGQLCEEELFYLRTRGLTAQEASQWLVEGFCREILETLPIPALRGEA